MQNHNSFPSSVGSHASWSPWSSSLSMTRRCSHCSNNGHNTRTCPTRSNLLASASSSPSLSSSSSNSNHNNGGWVKLFGVRLNDGSFIKKSASMGNLSSALHSSNNRNNSDSPSSDHLNDPPDDGYLSDDPNNHAASSSSPAPAIRRMAERKKGVPWTEEEHRLFLIGLKKLGKGDWRGIARNFVVSRTPTQVASHAQKYFIRHFSATRRKRRSSLFDMVPDMATDPRPVPEEHELLSSQARETNNADVLPSLNLFLKSEYEPMETASRGSITEPEKIEMGSNESEPNVSSSNEYVPIAPLSSEFIPYVPGFFPAYATVSYPFWPANTVPLEEARVPQTSQHQVLKPVPILPKDSVNVDELVGISQLSLGDTEKSHREPSPLSLKLVGEASRQSAFHANASVNGSGLSKGKAGAIQAI